MTESHIAEKTGSRETETAILEAARNLLAEGGLDALSMRAVASQVGLSATAIYHWFEGKEDLVDRVVLHGFRRSEAYMWKAIEELPAGSMDRVAALEEETTNLRHQVVGMQIILRLVLVLFVQ